MKQVSTEKGTSLCRGHVEPCAARVKVPHVNPDAWSLCCSIAFLTLGKICTTMSTHSSSCQLHRLIFNLLFIFPGLRQMSKHFTPSLSWANCCQLSGGDSSRVPFLSFPEPSFWFFCFHGLFILPAGQTPAKIPLMPAHSKGAAKLQLSEQRRATGFPNGEKKKKFGFGLLVASLKDN